MHEHKIRSHFTTHTRDTVLSMSYALEQSGKKRGRLDRIQGNRPAPGDPDRHVGLEIITEESWRKKMTCGSEFPQLIIHLCDETHLPWKIGGQRESWKRNQYIVGHGGDCSAY